MLESMPTQRPAESTTGRPVKWAKWESTSPSVASGVVVTTWGGERSFMGGRERDEGCGRNGCMKWLLHDYMKDPITTHGALIAT